MGSVCGCLSVENLEDYVNPNSTVYRNCMCFSCFIHNFLNVVCLLILTSFSIFFHVLKFEFDVSLQSRMPIYHIFSKHDSGCCKHWYTCTSFCSFCV